MYWYYTMIVAVPLILLGLARLGGANLLRKAFRNQGWTPFCRKEFGIHNLVVGGVFCIMGFSCRYFSFTQYETCFWILLLLIPTASDLYMLNKKYKALIK